MNRRTIAIGLAAVGCALLANGSAWAQRAAPKVRGDAYYIYIAEMYRDQAGANTFFLNAYAAGGPAEKAIVQEHAGGIRAGITAAQKAYGKISTAAKKDPAVVARLQAIEKDQAGILELCGKLDAEGAKDAPDSGKIRAACLAILDRIDAADATHARLMEQLQIKPIEALDPAK